MILDWKSFLGHPGHPIVKGSGGFQDKGDGRQVNQDYLLIECVHMTLVSSKCLVRLFYAMLS